MNFENIVKQRLDQLGLNAFSASKALNLKRDEIRDILRGRKPSIDKVERICQALGLDFYIGVPNNAAEQVADQASANEIAEFKNFQETIRCQMAASGLNPYRVALENGLPERAIKSVLEGRQPSFDRTVQIAKALGLDFHIGAPNNAAHHATHQPVADTPQDFLRLIPVIGMTACGKDGWASLGMNDFKATMPDRGMSDLSFAVIASGDSMQPYGIYPGAVCYCDPKVKPKLGHFLFIEKWVGRGKNRKKAMTIKRLEKIDTNGDIFVSGFHPMHHDEDDDPRETDMPYGMQFLNTEFIQRYEIIRTAVVCWINTNPVL